MDFAPRVKEDNPDPRIACALLLDTSYSMSGSPMEELNAGFQLFCQEVHDDDLTAKRAEIAVITFGGMARVEIPFTEGRDLQPKPLQPSGNTPMGAAIDLGLNQIEARKTEYKAAGLEYYRPWLFVLSDGEPTDGPVFTAAVQRLRAVEAARGVTVFGIGVGSQVNMSALGQLSGERTPIRLQGVSFREFFSWLSRSLSSASSSNAFGSSDSSAVDQQIPLPSPAGWAAV
ncbi:uncharacterized protein YegL [Actinoplanes tereljensis]|uniref:VWFA domain-containing protein n=1 Tax=Paractinoplanes tereljensis TaxID=571912 RepID=A0A919NZU6_9ACTN|nr:VWA domain-containing protein [Actinoplanes tereljensis]GIF26672.1 hypothetical protein Ate02nite_94020 [Actinoplanes tereljensis]